MGDETSPSNVGAVVSARGSVADIWFDDHLPPIYSVLRAGDEGQVVIEALAQRAARRVCGIALTPTQGLARDVTGDEPSALPAERGGQTFYFLRWPLPARVSVNARSKQRGARSLGG